MLLSVIGFQLSDFHISFQMPVDGIQTIPVTDG